MDRRDQLLDQLSELGQVSVDRPRQRLDQGRPSATPPTTPLVDDTTVTWPQTPRRWSPGRPARRAARHLASPAARSTRYRADARHRRQDARRRVNGAAQRRRHGPDFFDLHGRRRGAASRRVGTSPTPHDRRRRHAADRRQRLALAVSSLRGGAGDGAYRAFVAAGRRRRRAGAPRLRGQRPGADRLRRRPPPERLRRLDGRGDDQPRPLPARLPGLRARHVDDGRDARRADQPDRKGGARDIAHHAPHDPAQHPGRPQHVIERLSKTQQSEPPRASRSRARPTTRSTPPRAMACAQSLAAHAAVPAQHRGRAGLAADRPSTRWTHHRRTSTAPSDLLVQGASDTADPTSRDAIADEIDQIIAGDQADRERHLRRQLRLLGHRRPRRAPYALGADDTYQGDRRPGPGDAGVLREIGPGVSL